MAKRISKADILVFKAMQKAIEDNKLQICLINSKINIPGSPVYNPWEMLWPILAPVLLGLVLIGLVGVLLGLAVMVGGIILSSNVVNKKIEQRLYERAKNFFIYDYNSCNLLWEFGGIVLVNANDKRHGCIAPDGNWKEFVILHFADYMTEKKDKSDTEIEADNEKVA